MGEDGALRVLGRKKELIALSNGKKVAPLPIESALAGDPLIHQAMLYGEGRHFVSALLVVSRPALESWADGAPGGPGRSLRRPRPAAVRDASRRRWTASTPA